jgi:AraC-like DNA-binding protein
MSRNHEQIWACGPEQGKLKTIELQGAGNLKGKDYIIRWRPEFWGIGLVWKGTGNYATSQETNSRPVIGPCFFYVWPDEYFEYGPSDIWDESFICFSGSRCAEWENCGWLMRSSQVHGMGHVLNEIRDLHERLLRLLEGGSRHGLDLAKCLTEEILCILNTPEPSAANATSKTQKIEATVNEWKRNSDRPINLESTAEGLGMSYAHFRRIFREQTGNSPYDFIINQRISKACRLLASTGLSVKEISARAGFNYTESFNRAFLLKMGKSPQEYRASTYSRTVIPIRS